MFSVKNLLDCHAIAMPIVDIVIPKWEGLDYFDDCVNSSSRALLFDGVSIVCKLGGRIEDVVELLVYTSNPALKEILEKHKAPSAAVIDDSVISMTVSVRMHILESLQSYEQMKLWKLSPEDFLHRIQRLSNLERQ